MHTIGRAIIVVVAGAAALGGCGDAWLESEEVAEVLGAEVDVGPTVVGLAPGDQRVRVVLWDGDQYLVVWSDERRTFPSGVPAEEPRYTRIATDGTVLDPIGLPFPLSRPTGGCDGAGTCLLVDLRAATWNLVGVRVVDGVVIDAIPFEVTPPGTLLVSSDIAWDGNAFRIVGSEDGTSRILTATVWLDATVTAPVEIAAATAHDPQIACGSSSCFVAYRRSPNQTSTIRGRTVTAVLGGIVLGPEQAIVTAPGFKLATDAAWDGARYWVGGSLNGTGWVSRVEPAGTVLDPDGIGLFAASSMKLSFDGTQLVASGDGKATRLTATGAALEPGGVPFHGADNPDKTACGPGQCLWGRTLPTGASNEARAGRFVGVTQLDGFGAQVARTPPGTADAAGVHAFGAYALAWRDSRQTQFQVPPRRAIRGSIVSPDLDVIAAFDAGMAPNPRCGEVDQPAIAASSSAFLIVYREACELDKIAAQVLDPSGAPIGPALVLAGTAPTKLFSPSVASHGGGFLAVWHGYAAPRRVDAQLFDASGGRLGPVFPVAQVGWEAVVGFDGTNYLVVYQRAVGGHRNLYAQRVSPAGALVGGELAIFLGGQLAEGQSLACGGGQCLAVWRDFKSIRAARIDPSGGVLDPASVIVGPVTGTTSATAVAWDGSGFVAAWRTGTVIRLRRLDALAALDPTVDETIAPATLAERPVLVSDGAGQVIALYDRFVEEAPFGVHRVRAVVVAP